MSVLNDNGKAIQHLGFSPKKAKLNMMVTNIQLSFSNNVLQLFPKQRFQFYNHMYSITCIQRPPEGSDKSGLTTGGL